MHQAALIFDDSINYLDHLIPFCALASCPLVVCDPHIADLVKLWAPEVKVIEKELLGLGSFLSCKFDQIVSCSAHSLLRAAFPNLTSKLFWLPHGNSDKGLSSYYFEELEGQEGAFVYGQQMVDRLAERKISIAQLIRIGHFRSLYSYPKAPAHKIFHSYEKTVLYAPTWDCAEKSCSLWDALPALARTIPASMRLIVKPHPNTLLHHPEKLEQLMGKIATEQVVFILEFVPLMCLAKNADCFLGDLSSMGYDFLWLNKPLFFFKNEKKHPLWECGWSVTAETFWEHLKSRLAQDEITFSRTKKELSIYVFDAPLLSGLWKTCL